MVNALHLARNIVISVGSFALGVFHYFLLCDINLPDTSQDFWNGDIS